MKIQKIDTTVKTSETFSKMDFDIKAENKGFILDLLRSKIYSDPIGSICREIASNARDANREMGKGHIPIEIIISNCNTLFSANNCHTITFKDCGPGISPDRMSDVFVNYGQSTKRDSNAETGAFGLGAKTPFAYSDQFSIVTVVDGKKYTYIAACGVQEAGSIIPISTEDVDEPNGTSIVIPVEEKDILRFESSSYEATRYWDPMPVYIGFTKKTDKPVLVVDEKDFCLPDYQSEQYNGSKIGVLLDGISYPIDEDKFNFPNRFYNKLFTVLFKFSTDEYNVSNISANRETLYYNDDTIKKIQSKIDLWLEHCKNKNEELIKDYKTDFERISFSNYVNYCLIHRRDLAEKFYSFLYADCIIDTKIGPISVGNRRSDYLQSFFTSLEFVVVKRYDERNHSIFHIGINLDKPKKFFLCDNMINSSRRNKTLIQEFPDHEIILIRPIKKQLYRWKKLGYSERKRYLSDFRESLKKIKKLEEFGIEYSLYSKVKETPLEPSSKPVRKRVPNEFFNRCFAYRNPCISIPHSSMTIKGAHIEFQNSTYKLPLNECYYTTTTRIPLTNQKYCNDHKILEQYKIIASMRIPNFKARNVILVNKKDEYKIKGKIKPLDSFFSDLTEKQKTVLYYFCAAAVGGISSEFFKILPHVPEMKELPFIDDFLKEAPNSTVIYIRAFEDLILEREQYKKIEKEFLENIRMVLEKYPLIAYFTKRIHATEISEMCDYINTINHYLELKNEKDKMGSN